MSVKELAASGIRGKLRGVLRFCDNCSDAVFTTIVEAIELSGEGVELKRKNAKLFDRNTDM